jgi:hypothetical protein
MFKEELLTRMKIAQVYPDKIAIVPIHDERRNKYSASIYELETGNKLGETLYSFKDYTYPNEDAAVSAMAKFASDCKYIVKTMSN